MVVAFAPPLKQIQLSPGSAILVKDLTWSKYEAVLQEFGEGYLPRFTYNGGILEIRMPSKLHEIVNRLISKIIFTLAEEYGFDCRDLGSTTWNREDFAQGVEPDSCFYIQNAEQIRGLNPEIPAALPPDLVVEVDIASSSAQRLEIYRSFGVPEVWIYSKNQLRICILLDGNYIYSSKSKAFTNITVQQINQWIKQAEIVSDVKVVRGVRQFCREIGNEK